VTGRGLAGRRRAEALLVIAITLVGLEVFFFVTAPHDMGPMFFRPPLWTVVVLAIGIIGQAGGLAWMIRIYRATLDPEAHRSLWRSHRR